jgi:hypothetical protein
MMVVQVEAVWSRKALKYGAALFCPVVLHQTCSSSALRCQVRLVGPCWAGDNSHVPICNAHPERSCAPSSGSECAPCLPFGNTLAGKQSRDMVHHGFFCADIVDLPRPTGQQVGLCWMQSSDYVVSFNPD